MKKILFLVIVSFATLTVFAGPWKIYLNTGTNPSCVGGEFSLMIKDSTNLNNWYAGASHPTQSLNWRLSSCSGTIIQAVPAGGSPALWIYSAPSINRTYYAQLSTGECLSYTISVEVAPVTADTITGNNSVCKGSTAHTYNTPPISNATSYLWSYSGTGATIIGSSNSISINFLPSATSGNLTVRGVNSCGNGPVSDNYSITVHSLPYFLINPFGATICQGNSVALNASAGFTYLWSTSETTQSIVVSTSGIYSVTVTDGNGCTSNRSVQVNVNPLPPTPTITENGTTLTSSSAIGYQWYLNGNILNGATLQNYTVTQNGNYTVVITDSNSCSMTSAPFNFTTVGIEDLSVNNSIIVIPNPSNGIFRIETNKIQFSKIKIYNTIGKIIYESENRNTEINLSNQPKGAYFIEIYSQDKIYNKKLIIQ